MPEKVSDFFSVSVNSDAEKNLRFRAAFFFHELQNIYEDNEWLKKSNRKFMEKKFESRTN